MSMRMMRIISIDKMMKNIKMTREMKRKKKKKPISSARHKA